ncbi:MAG: hypothetical protein CL489_11835 [Acidobacteria bacterium]|nr:hypothetical protein [Acidobacteriota bacterium]
MSNQWSFLDKFPNAVVSHHQLDQYLEEIYILLALMYQLVSLMSLLTLQGYHFAHASFLHYVIDLVLGSSLYVPKVLLQQFL